MTAGKSDPLLDLLDRLRRRRPPEPPDFAHEPLEQFIFSFLLWETTTSKATLARKRLAAAFVDCNDLRVAMPSEVVEALGPRYPRAEERALRLRAALNDLFRREDRVSLAHLLDAPKRDARQYLDSLDGAPQYVAARVALIGLGAHALPLDERLHALLERESAFEESLSLEDAAASLERRIRAADSLEAHLLLQAWSDRAPTSRRSGGRSSGRGGARDRARRTASA